MTAPLLFHDPTSEPSRAVHWFAVEAGIQLELRYTWLTRGEHRAPELLVVNPGHQVPTLQHGALCLPEASAIMIYLAELEGLDQRWIGATVEQRAQTHRFLSWHHTNTRLKITLDYVLPVLLMPAYKGVPAPPPEEVSRLRTAGREALALLEQLLEQRGDFLGGECKTVADLFIAADLFALDMDPDAELWLADLPTVSKWLQRLRECEGYRVSHAAWNALVPRLKELVSTPATTIRDPRWVADLCLQHVP